MSTLQLNNYPTNISNKMLSKSITECIDVLNTSTDRKTFYSTLQDQKSKLNSIHYDMLNINRGIYSILLMLDGITDFSKMTGVHMLLKHNDVVSKNGSMISMDIENKILFSILDSMPVHRALNLFLLLKEHRINNARVRNLVLGYLFTHTSFDFWAIKYKNKIKTILTHVWGKRYTGIIKSIATKVKSQQFIDTKETNILQNYLLKHSTLPTAHAIECVLFIFGDVKNLTIDLLKSYENAKVDLSKGKGLPVEVLEGIRSTYHKNINSSKSLEIGKETLTSKETLKVQETAKRKNVTVNVNIQKQNPLDLYIYGYKKGSLSTEDINSIKSTVKKYDITKLSIFQNTKIGVVIDCSKSMNGHDTQLYRPIAMAQVFAHTIKSIDTSDVIIKYAGGKTENNLIIPEGKTNLAEPVIELLKENVNKIIIISDGYENASSGRVNEVISIAKDKLKLDFSIYHINPVISHTSIDSGVKRLGDNITTIPANTVKAISSAFVSAMLQQNPKDGIIELFKSLKHKLS